MIQLVENEQNFRHQQEAKRLDAEIRDSRTGLWFAFFLGHDGPCRRCGPRGDRTSGRGHGGWRRIPGSSWRGLYFRDQTKAQAPHKPRHKKAQGRPN